MSNTCITRIENYWKIKTKNANDLFNQGNYNEALTYYTDALYRAEVLTKNTRTCNNVGIPFMQVYMISCNNLANTYKELGNPKQAVRMLKNSVYYLLHLIEKNKNDTQEIQLELRRATLNYFSFTEEIQYTNKEDYLMLVLKENVLKNEA
ncbi:tetratricopeptide repeat protein [Tenacibaculum finnmarkense]|uniref:tetratricopeptide repeat protein n=1 Tax=Tenacibaculum finnmarkense TaxID=2781243 RepID=UPI001EFA6AA2|nr:tetratricopeptide repeat protein [Tenacibaculum finnmarkense]MCG8805511.1 tetratricopeptide repeat protein [Tenacibaculum finnmarkense]MCG8856754.1 tetratricopeptide repeat protein [Tenacibaculum finnmarkense]